MPVGSSEASENRSPKSLNSSHIAWKKRSSTLATLCIVLSHSRKCFIGGSLFLATLFLPRLSTPLSESLAIAGYLSISMQLHLRTSVRRLLTIKGESLANLYNSVLSDLPQ